MNIRIEASPMYDPRDGSIKRIRIVKSVNGNPTRGFIAFDVEEAKEIIRGWYHLNRKFRVKVIWPFA